MDYEALAEQIEMAALQHGEAYDLLDRRIAALKASESLALPPEIDDWPAETCLAWETGTGDGLKATAPFGITMVNSTAIETNLPEALREQGVILLDFTNAFRVHPRLIERFYMQKAIQAKQNQLTALHLAYQNAGVFLYIPKNVQLDQPVEINVIQQTDQPFHVHYLVVAEENSRVLVNEHVQLATTTPVTFFTEVIAQKNSHVTYQATQLTTTDHCYILREAAQRREAKVNWREEK